MSSSRVRSAPRASAMVERRWMAFNRSRTSSCYIKGFVRFEVYGEEGLV